MSKTSSICLKASLWLFQKNEISFTMAKICPLSLKLVAARISGGTRPDPLLLHNLFLYSYILISVMSAISSTSLFILSPEHSSVVVSSLYITSFLLGVFSRSSILSNSTVLLESPTFLSFFWKDDSGFLSGGTIGVLDHRVINRWHKRKTKCIKLN